MKEIIQEQFKVAIAVPFGFLIAILSARYFVGHVLFHSLAELFTVLVALTMAAVAYFTYRFTKNDFLIYLGMGYFWIASLDLFHMLTFKGMMIFSTENANITLTFWVLSRLFEVLLLLSAPFVHFRLISRTKVFLLFASLSGLIYWLAFSEYRLDLYSEKGGLTALKTGIEYTVVLLLLVAMGIYREKKESFDRFVFRYLLASMVFTAAAELTLTNYIDFHGYSSLAGHLFKFLSYWMIFLAVVQTALQKPFSLLARGAGTYDAIPVPAVVVDTGGVIRRINQATLDFLSLAENEVLNHSNHRLFHDKAIKESECVICQSIAIGQSLSAYELSLPSASRRFTVSPLRLENESAGSIQVCVDISEQKEIERELLHERNLLKTVINTVPIRIFWKDRDFRYLGCNGLFAKDANADTEKEIIGQSDYDMPWRERAGSCLFEDSRVMRTKQSRIDVEEMQTGREGQKTWINTSLVPLFGENKTVEGVLGIYFDISDRKEAEAELLRTNRLLSNAERMGHVGSWELDLQTKKLLWSDEVFRIHGERVGAFVPTLEISKSYMSEEDRHKIEDILDLIEKKEEIRPISYKLNRKDGSVRDILLINELVVSDDGLSQKLVGIIIDETERVASEQELRKLQTAVEQSPVSIVITDTNGEIEYVNPQFTRISGYSTEEVLGKNPRVLSSGLTTPLEYTALWNTISHDEIWSGVFKNINKSGESYWESAIISPIKNKEGEIVNYIGVKQDISEKIAMESLLREQEELMIVQSRHAAMGDMIGMIAHQWRQPLSVISMGASNLLIDIEMENINASAFKEEANSIIEQVNHLSQTIDDFRNYFRPDREKEASDIEETIHEVLHIIGKSLENNEIEVSLFLAPGIVANIFRRELVQVLINVINNAKEAMNEHCKGEKKLSISTKETADEVSIEICDNGGGIDEKIMQRIFEPYFSTKDKQTGTGLGLFMSKTIMEKHLNGAIHATRNKPDGTCFILTIYK